MSGTGYSGKYPWTLSVRLLSNQIPRAAVRTTLTYRFHQRLTAGIEYNPRAGEFAPLANFLVVTETERRPAIMIGTSTDRIGTPSGQAFFGTISKNLSRETGLPIAPYIGTAYGTYEKRFRPIGGVSIFFDKNFSALITFNGVHIHPLVNFTHRRHVLSLVMVKGRDPGFSYSIVF